MVHLNEKGENVRNVTRLSFMTVNQWWHQELSNSGRSGRACLECLGRAVSGLKPSWAASCRTEAESGVKQRVEKAKKGCHFLSWAPPLGLQTFTDVIVQLLSCSYEFTTANWMDERKSQRSVDQEIGNPTYWISHPSGW